MVETYDLQLFIDSKKSFYEKLINDTNCDNREELKKRIEKWTEEDWMNFMEEKFNTMYVLDRATKTFKKI